METCILWFLIVLIVPLYYFSYFLILKNLDVARTEKYFFLPFFIAEQVKLGN